MNIFEKIKKDRRYTKKEIIDASDHGDEVCFECGVNFLSKKQMEESGVCTFNTGKCCLCQKNKSVTHIRHYNYLVYPS